MRRNVVLHPFLFALYPVLYLYSRNAQQVSILSALVPAVVLLLLAYLLLRGATKLYGDSKRAAVSVSGFFVWLFSYSAVRSMILFDVGGFKLYRHRYLTVIWCAVLVLFLLALRRYRIRSAISTWYANAVAVILVLFPLSAIASQHLADHHTTRFRQPIAHDSIRALSTLDSLPDIYYIVLDAYTGQHALKAYLNFDNTEFVQHLQRKGFFVADSSHSNYAWTGLSIASTLNMEYLLMKPTDSARQSFEVDGSVSEYQMIEQAKVMSFLESRGYEFIDLSIWSTTPTTDLGSVHSMWGTDDFNIGLLSMTIARRPLVEDYLLARTKRESVMRRFDDLKTIRSSEKPIFVYAHILIPHPYYVFDRNGEIPPTQRMLAQTGSEGDMYLDQLLFANKEVEEVIDSITVHSQRPPIVVIQGDHGAYQLAKGDTANQKVRMSILNAYLVPNEIRGLLYKSITPVNTFRVIFKSHFGENLPLLPDESFFSERESRRRLRNVTNLVTQG